MDNKTQRQVEELPGPPDDEHMKNLKKAFEPTRLYTRDGNYVTTVWVPVTVIPFEGVLWGQRSFFYDPKRDNYFEGISWYIGPTNPSNFFEKDVELVK